MALPCGLFLINRIYIILSFFSLSPFRFAQEILLILFSSFHSLCVLRNTLPPLAFASLIRLILSLERPRKLIGAQVVKVVFNNKTRSRFRVVVVKIQRSRFGCSQNGERWQLIAEHFGKVGSLRNKIYKISARRARSFFFLRVGAKLFFISVVVIYPYQTSAKGQYLSKCYQ